VKEMGIACKLRVQQQKLKVPVSEQEGVERSATGEEVRMGTFVRNICKEGGSVW